MATMQAMLLTGYGGVDKYQLRRIPIPEPKPDEVLVKISAIALNNTDVNTRIGAYGDGSGEQQSWDGTTMQFPWIQGCDACGYIVKLGTNHAHQKQDYIGKRVLINPIINKLNKHGEEYLDKYIGSELPGTYAEYIAVPMDNIYIMDTAKVRLKDYELCTFLCAYITAQGMMANGGIKPNETVLVSGASGGVGVALTQLLLNMNARPIIIVGSQQKAQRVLDAMKVDGHGDKNRIIVLSRDKWYSELVNQYSDIEIDAVMDVVSGNQNFNDYLKVLRVGGRVVTAGAIAGSQVTINIRNVYLKWIKIIGSTCGTKQDFLTLMKCVEAGKLQPMVYRKFDGIGSIPAAQTEFLKKRHIGKIVVDYNMLKAKL